MYYYSSFSFVNNRYRVLYYIFHCNSYNQNLCPQCKTIYPFVYILESFHYSLNFSFIYQTALKSSKNSHQLGFLREFVEYTYKNLYRTFFLLETAMHHGQLDRRWTDKSPGDSRRPVVDDDGLLRGVLAGIVKTSPICDKNTVKDVKIIFNS